MSSLPERPSRHTIIAPPQPSDTISGANCEYESVQMATPSSIHKALTEGAVTKTEKSITKIDTFLDLSISPPPFE
jgi:hypothetical protein